MRVRVLGPLHAEGERGEVTLGSAKERLLLGALALSPGRIVGPDTLINALWGDEPPATARKTLQTYVSNLRRRLGADTVATEPSGYRLCVGVDDVDVSRFRVLTREGDQAARSGSTEQARTKLAEAIALWRGEPFSDAPSASALAAESVRLHEEYLSALEARVAADLATGCHAEVVGELEVLVREYPFRERLSAQLMTALYRSGRQADALASYQRARTVLSEELGLEPGAELRRLERAVLDHDPSLDLPTRFTAADTSSASVPRSPVRYALIDGVHVAYQTLGDGPTDLLAFPNAVLLPIDAIDDEPRSAAFQDRLASFSRVIRFDPRGIGFSDPVVASGPSTLEQWFQDALAVLDAAGAQQAVLFAPTNAAPTALLMATTHPDRVRGLVIVNGSARVSRADDYPVGIPQHFIDQFLDINFEPDAVDRGYDFLEISAPSVARDTAFRAWWDKAGQRGASPAAARSIQEVSLTADVRSLLPLVRVPTLVLHRRGTKTIRVDHGRYLANHIPEARYVELDGADDLHWVGDTLVILDEIEEFVNRATSKPSPNRVLTTILFADLIASQPNGDRDGDARYDAMVARQLARLGGRPVRRTGGGPLAVFDGPARAVTCACAIRDGAAQLGLKVHAGLHTGEVEIRSDDIAGPAVGVGAAIAAIAEADEVLVSRTVVDLVAGSGLRFVDRGLHDLTGVPDTWRLFSAGG